MNLDALMDALATDEGFAAKVYRCPAGYLSIGYGRNLESRGVNVEEASNMLRRDAIEGLRDASDLVRNFALLNDVRQNVLANMAMNMGKGGLAGFKRMIAAVERKDWMSAAAEMENSAWYRQVGKRAERLVKEMLDGKTAINPVGGGQVG